MKLAAILVPLLAPLLAAVAVAACTPAVPAHTALVVNGAAQPEHLYDVLLATSRHEAQTSGVPAVSDPTYAAARARSQEGGALRTLAEDALVEQLARKFGVSVSAADVAGELAHREALAGGAAALDRYIAARGVTRADYATFLRLQLLRRKLEARFPMTFARLLAAALKAASMQAYVGPCASDHAYPACAA